MDEITRRPPSTPKGLDLHGRRMWKRVVSAYQLRPDELFVLDSACRTLDTASKLEAAMEGEPLLVKGSMGQMREHPLLSEARQQRALLARLLAQLKLPEDGTAEQYQTGPWSAFDRSMNARNAARARWQRGS